MPHANSRNKYDKKDSLELGARAENLFVSLAKNLGWIVSPASKDENIDEHSDDLIEKEVLAFKAEVKSRKRIRRDHDGTPADLTWGELHGVRPKDRGWLFGTADLIAFKKEKSFILVNKTDPLMGVDSKVDLVDKVRDPKDALYKISSRKGRNDQLTLLRMQDIEAIKFKEWQK
jgi:hypothetical protein